MPSPKYAVSERRGTRYLELAADRSFSLSSMPLADPGALIAPYMREMMKSLALQPTPSAILMLGVGGGSQVKYLLQHVPRARIVGVDHDREIVEMAQASFFLPEPGPRLQFVFSDAAHHMAADAAAADLILLDVCSPDLPDSVTRAEFYEHVRRALRPGGVFCANHYRQGAAALAEQRARLTAVFEWVHMTRVAPDNVVFFALRDRLPEPDWLERHALALEGELRLALPAFVRSLPRPAAAG